ncbi:MAG: Crp/Fnr family transcriptional regulator [Alphaproteobacteria bacterium]|nr:Crp/Fnr family transcriptional regulator [Alphaproteobacteria bacterium]
MKKNASRDGISNRILLRLTPKDFGLLGPDLSPVELPLRKPLEAPNTPIEHVYFIESGFASVVADGRGDSIEVGLVGREGMTGLAVVMGATSSPNATFIQCEGRGLRMLATALTHATERSPTLQRVVLQYAHTFAVQAAHTALANGRSNLRERLARWLLMAHDRIDGNKIVLTHEFLAIMLGVRRAGVTVALKTLEESRLTRAEHGCVYVLDRKGLEKAARKAYGVPEAEFRRLFD